ncbi:hypothetical protein BDZ94DRAFT_1259765 [Collybia nuda]|uniref:Uncharacterized protein n=1 Tax=Collybia nuda TaxID=64659 RepID=A0A9P5Y7I0_9AGAR|nr:hypothetical protein BDZ94DRAFT_1259765 [Collybia nuda]
MVITSSSRVLFADISCFRWIVTLDGVLPTCGSVEPQTQSLFLNLFHHFIPAACCYKYTIHNVWISLSIVVCSCWTCMLFLKN